MRRWILVVDRLPAGGVERPIAGREVGYLIFDLCVDRRVIFLFCGIMEQMTQMLRSAHSLDSSRIQSFGCRGNGRISLGGVGASTPARVPVEAIQFADKQTNVIKTPTRTVCSPHVAAPTHLWVNRLRRPAESRLARG
jgi:hypothetical protein